MLVLPIYWPVDSELPYDRDQLRGSRQSHRVGDFGPSGQGYRARHLRRRANRDREYSAPSSCLGRLQGEMTRFRQAGASASAWSTDQTTAQLFFATDILF